MHSLKLFTIVEFQALEFLNVKLKVSLNLPLLCFRLVNVNSNVKSDNNGKDRFMHSLNSIYNNEVSDF